MALVCCVVLDDSVSFPLSKSNHWVAFLLLPHLQVYSSRIKESIALSLKELKTMSNEGSVFGMTCTLRRYTIYNSGVTDASENILCQAGAGNYRLELLLEIKIKSRQDARRTTTTTGCSKPGLLVKIDMLKVEGLTLAGQRAEGGCSLLSVRSSQEIPLIIPRLQHVFLSSFRTLHLLNYPLLISSWITNQWVCS
ncbi:hypothetical protein R1flu_000843 [Riccia fluitans]|uniref:Uncharacterized protein n=1 Tax=Riccia fluitans TaxID=41844 RepID=A0ABD1Y1J8_9MARC